MPRPNITPPAWATRLLAWYCRPDLFEDLQGDLHEYFQRNLARKGPRYARFVYCLDVLKFFRSYTVRKPQPAMTQFIVYQNYLTTSLRYLGRNKLFSVINIIGLAISMSVALILIAFIAELKSYDSFHTHYDRIYRVNNIRHSVHGVDDFASTSILTGKKIKESVPGIADVAILRTGFSRDLTVGEKVVPLSGLWADASFFSVFTFPLLSGNAATALREPNSVVLTETSAQKVFGSTDVAGKLVQIDTLTYTVTAVMKDVPLHSHLRFDMLGSFSTIDAKRLADNDPNWMRWDNMWQNFAYLLLIEGTDPANLQVPLARFCQEQNKTLTAGETSSIDIRLQPLSSIALGPDLSNEIGPTFNQFIAAVLSVLAFVVIISACFNYANLSIARSLRRLREVGVRKVSGATRTQVFQQFVVEAVVIALIALAFSFLLFLLLRPGLLSMDPIFSELVTLQPTLAVYGWFVLFAIVIGMLAGVLPAAFLSNANTAQVLKNLSSVKLFGHLTLRKGLILFQYTLSLLFIVGVSLAYRQYQFSISYDLGLTTTNILNVNLQGNKPDLLVKEFGEVPEVTGISRSVYVPAVGTSWSDFGRYNDPTDSR